MLRTAPTTVLALVIVAGLVQNAAHAQKIYWVTDTIQRANLDGSDVEELITKYRVNAPYGVAVDVDGGKMYWTNGFAGGVHRANLDGTDIEEVASEPGVAKTLDIAVDPAGGKVYWVEGYWMDRPGRIRRADLDGSNVETVLDAEVRAPVGLALDLDAGKMYCSDYDSGGAIRRADLDGSNVEDVVTGQASMGTVALDLVGGKAYWADVTNDTIRRANLDGTDVEVFVSAASHPWDIAIDSAGGKVYWTRRSRDLRRANLDGSDVEVLEVEGSHQVWGIALDVTAGVMYLTDVATHTIRRANLDGSNVVEFFKEVIGGPCGIELDLESGKMYWTDHGRTHQVPSGLMRADLDGTNIEAVITPLEENWTDLTLDVVARKLYFANAEYGMGSIDRANLDGTGIEEVVAPYLAWPLGLAAHWDAGTMFWIAIDYHSGYKKIQRANLDGSGLEDLIEGLACCSPSRLAPIAVDPVAGKLYWVADDFHAGVVKIQRANLDGSDAEVVLELAADEIVELALDLADGKMYWTGHVVGEAVVQRMNLDGSGLETVITGDGSWQGIALDLRASGDCDRDGSLTLADYAAFAGCVSGPGAVPPAGCGCANLNGDAHVDLSDFAAFQLTFSTER